MGTVNSNLGVSISSATAYGNQRKTVVTSKGVLWSFFPSAASGNSFTAWYSTDNGATWTRGSGSDVVTGSGGTSATYTPSISVACDADDYLHAVFKDNTNGLLYYRRGTPTSAAHTAYTWSAAVALTGSVNGNVPDVVAHRDPAGSGGWFAHVVYSSDSPTTTNAFYQRLTISSAGAVTGAQTVTTLGTYSVSALSYPSIDFRHTGDAKTVAGGQPDLFVGWSAGTTGTGFGLRFKKATYSAGSWTWGTEREIDPNHKVSSTTMWQTCHFDGTRAVVTGFVYSPTAPATYDVVIHDRDAADTTTTTRTVASFADASGTTASGAFLANGSATYDAAGNVYVFGAEINSPAGSANAAYRKWDRTSGTLGARVTIDATANATPYVSVRRGTSGARLDYIYTDGTGSTYTITSGQVVLNSAPTAPTGLAPASGTIDRSITQRLSWLFGDPDVGDSQSKFDLQWRLNNGGSTTPGAWTTVTATTPNQYADIPGGTFPDGIIEWRLLDTYDSQGAVSPPSASVFFTAHVPPTAPTITAPVSGATIPGPSVVLQISAPNVDALRYRVLGDTGGVADPAKVLQDVVTVIDPTVRQVTVTGLPNLTTVHLQAAISYQGLWSGWADSRNPVSYTPPPTPVITGLTPVEVFPGAGPSALRVAWSIPAPAGSQPAVTAITVLVDDGAGFEPRALSVAPAGPWLHPTPVAGRDYTSRVRLVATGANGTTSSTP